MSCDEFCLTPNANGEALKLHLADVFGFNEMKQNSLRRRFIDQYLNINAVCQCTLPYCLSQSRIEHVVKS